MADQVSKHYCMSNCLVLTTANSTVMDQNYVMVANFHLFWSKRIIKKKRRRKERNPLLQIGNKSWEGPTSLEYKIKEGNIVDNLGNKSTPIFGPFERN